MADAEALIPCDGKALDPEDPARRASRRHYAEDFWNMRIIGVSTELFFMITQEVYLCREFLYKYVWAGAKCWTHKAKSDSAQSHFGRGGLILRNLLFAFCDAG